MKTADANLTVVAAAMIVRAMGISVDTVTLAAAGGVSMMEIASENSVADVAPIVVSVNVVALTVAVAVYDGSEGFTSCFERGQNVRFASAASAAVAIVRVNDVADLKIFDGVIFDTEKIAFKSPDVIVARALVCTKSFGWAADVALCLCDADIDVADDVAVAVELARVTRLV